MLDLSKVWPEWTAEEKLGEGAYGSVYKCVRRERGITSYCAIKVITVPHDSSELDSLKLEGYTDETSKEYFNDIVDNFVNEISVMENLKGLPNIVSVEDFKIVEHADNVGWDIYIRMELLTSFKRYLENHAMTQNEVLKFGTDICAALEICEENRIIHRDIKEDNIFVDKRGNFKLGDFGIAKQLERTRSATSHVGAYAYMAPEVPINGRCDKRADIYSLGIVMYKLLNKNRDPFLDTEKQMIRFQERVDAVNRRLDGEALPKPVNADDAVAEIILKACKFNKEERFASAAEMKSAIENILTPKKEPEIPEEKVQTTIQEEITEEVKPEESKTPKFKVEIMPEPSKPSKINIKTVGIIAAVVAVIVVAGVFGIKAIKAKPDTSEDDSLTSTTQNQEIVHNLYESFLESTEAKKYFEVTPAFADYYTNYEEYENYVNGISSTSKKLDYFDLDADGTDECVMSVCFINPEALSNYVYYIFDLEGETVKCVDSANELYGGHRSLSKLQIYQHESEYYIRKYLHDPHLRCGSVYKYNGKSLDFVESVYATDENSESYIFTNVYSDKYDLFNKNASNYLAFPTEEKYNDFVTDYGIKELTEEEYYKIVEEYDNNEVYHILGNEDAAPADAANAEETSEALEIIEQGTLTDTISWILYKNGLLSIEGTGDMPDYKDSPWNKKSVNEVSVSHGITSIGNSAFYGCIILSNVTLPDSITSIGSYAFHGCESLTNIEIPNNVTSIGEWAFAYCNSLTSITIPDSVTIIEDYLFSDCSNLTNIDLPESIKGIGEYTFSSCTNLKNITIPDSVTTIGDSSFSNCLNLANITIPNGVTSIGEFMFSSCTSLKSVTIPDSVTSIEAHAFFRCASLESITIPNSVTSIGEWAFYECTSLTSIAIPDGVTEIEQATFNGCTNLTSITIPVSTTSIHNYTFYNCDMLSDVYYSGSVLDWYAISIDEGNTPLTTAKIHYYS